MGVSIIAAMSRGRVIGTKGGLPWHLPEDLKRFSQLTRGHPVVMGRKTFESIGRLLPGRENRIVTRRDDFGPEGARVFRSLPDALEDSAGEIFVIGGAEIYAQAMSIADRIYLTLIDCDVEGDTYFPAIDELQFREIAREEYLPAPGRDFGFSFLILERMTTLPGDCDLRGPQKRQQHA
jgi:dihydrofolate reductase